MKKVIKKSSKDNVATALESINFNEVVQIISEKNESIGEIEALESIPFGNKIALCHINGNADIVKYGVTIGISTKEIGKGKLVHVHNVRSQRVYI